MFDTKSPINHISGESILFAQRADSLIKEHLLDDAVRLCESGIKKFPFYAQGHYTLARCYELSGRSDEAKKEYERTLLYSPKHLRALKSLVQIYKRDNLLEAANNLLLSVALCNPMDNEAVEQLKAQNIYMFDSGASPEEAHEVEAPDTVEEISEPQMQIEEGEDELVEETMPVEMIEEEFVEEEIPSTEFDEIADEENIEVREEEEDAIEDEEIEDEQEIDTAPESDEIEEDEIEFETSSGDVSTIADIETEIIEEDIAADETSLFLDNDEETNLAEDEEIFLDDVEVNNEQPEEHAAENPKEEKADLSQYANVKDDFSTLMEDMFHPSADNDLEDDWPELPELMEGEEEAEQEQIAEERPILDTTLIFMDKKQSDDREREKDEEGFEPIQSVDEERVTESDSFELKETLDEFKEERLEEEEQSAEDNFPITSPASSDVDVDDDLTDVIEQIESDTKDSKAELKPSDSGEEDKANIDEIMNNPNLLTPTFGEILIAQKKFPDALKVFRKLSKKDPDNPRLKKKLDFLNKLVSMEK